MKEVDRIYTKVNGLNFRPKEDRQVYYNADAGEIIRLEREPENKYDKHAVKCLVERPTPSYGTIHDWVFVGYVPKEHAPKVSRALAEGKLIVQAYKALTNDNSMVISFNEPDTEVAPAEEETVATVVSE